jgi:hypothetical protein
MRYNSKCGLDLNVYLRVTEKPEEVLVLYYVSSASRQEERSIEVSVS